MRLSLVLLILSIFNIASAQSIKYGFTPAQDAWMAEQNQQNITRELFDEPDSLTFDLLTNTTVRPFAEYEEAGYLIFSSAYEFNSRKAKRIMAENLPEDVTLVIYTYTDSKNHVDGIKARYKDVISPERLKVIYLPSALRGFWARDGIPVPVWRSDSIEQLFTVVDAPYYHYFEPDHEVSLHFGAQRTKHSYYFEGGNFMANSKNECLVVNKQATAQMPDSVFRNHYGCEKLVRLPFIKGIGHADESVKFVDDKTVLTDAPSYRPILENAGFNVVMLPRPYNEYETYVNSLLINGTIYVPIFGSDRDEEALQIYRDQGFQNVIGINTAKLSNDGLGSLHCITMTYPKVPFTELIDVLDGQEM